MLRFLNRQHAGCMLAQQLQAYKDSKNTQIFALPRGGVPVAYEVAKTLNLPLDVFLVRKLGVPGNEELALGAIALSGIKIFNEGIIKAFNLSPFLIEKIIKKEQREIDRRNQLYRQNQPLPTINDQTIILIDDGLATGATMRAAIASLKQYHPKEIIAAIPIAARDTLEILTQEIDKIICLQIPEPFYGVGMWYKDFSQTTDQEVCYLLQH